MARTLRLALGRRNNHQPGKNAASERSALISGLELSRQLHGEVIAPVLARRFPHLRYASARLDSGSDVLGFDTSVSRDHGWGPRVTVFLGHDDLSAAGAEVRAALAEALPATIAGVATRFARPTAQAPDAFGHGIEVTTVEGFFSQWLGCDPRQPLTIVEWLAAPASRLRAVADGAVWHDGLGELGPARERLRWYPDDVWHALMATQWRRLAEQEAFVGRCGDVADELGSRLVAARQVRELMRVVFLLSRVYPPYSKWFGSAFRQLDLAAELEPGLARVFDATDWRGREDALNAAYAAVGAMHNAASLTPAIDLSVRRFHERPYRVLDVGRFAMALDATHSIGDVVSGAAWQWIDDAKIDEAPLRTRAAIHSQRPDRG